MSTVFHESPPPWYESVKDLAPGAKRRLGDGHLASFNGKAYHRYDFREKTSEVYEPKLSLREKLAILAQQAVAVDTALQSNSPPGPRMRHPRDWPVAARAWLHRAGLNNDDIEHMGAYWNPELLRVVIPYRQLSGETTWVARSIQTAPGQSTAKGPKYLNPLGGRRGGGAFTGGVLGALAPLVLTEDLLSARRVAHDAGNDALAVMGTSLDRETIALIVRTYPGALLWLDGDYWGRQGARKIGLEFSRLDFPVERITTQDDPKLHNAAFIAATVAEASGRLSSG